MSRLAGKAEGLERVKRANPLQTKIIIHINQLVEDLTSKRVGRFVARFVGRSLTHIARSVSHKSGENRNAPRLPVLRRKMKNMSGGRSGYANF